MPALPIKIWTGRPVLHIAVPCDEKEPPMVHTMHQKTPKKKKKGKESFYLGNLRILKFQFDNCHARGENRFTNRYKNLSIVTDV